MSNTAEGFDRGTDADFARFLDMARASASEVKSLLFVCLDAEFVAQPTFDLLLQHCEKTQALIAGFQDYLRNPKVRDGEDVYSTWPTP
jgi:four helix bundle protein